VSTQQPVPRLFRSLVDDAAIFPPGDAPMGEAVPAHHEHRAAAYRELVGSFVVSDVRLPELLEVASTGSAEPAGSAEPPDAALDVTVVVTGGAGAIEPAVRWAEQDGTLALRGVEVALRDEEDLAHNARRVTTVVDHLLSSGQLTEEVPVYLEPPRLHDEPAGHAWLAALDEVAAADLRLKLRTGGVSADAFPTSAELATCIDAALDRELPFKCTAGLHHAVRHTATEGFERPVGQHGFLNVLLATRAGLDGAGVGELAAVLEEQDAAEVGRRVGDADQDTLSATRDWFISFGSCSVLEPLEDLVDLGLLPHLSSHQRTQESR